MNSLLVEFWHCRCDKKYRSQRATFQRLAAFLPNQSTDSAAVNILCDSCNSLRSYNKTALGAPDMVDSSRSGRYVYVQKIFLAQISCDDKTCKFPISVLVPSTEHWTKRALMARSGNWLPDAAVTCQKGHRALTPVQLVDLQRIYPGKDSMEDDMTTKEMTLALLDLVEKLESDRAALMTELELIRYPDGRQPDVKQITSDRRSLGPIELRNTQLRHAIALAADDDAPLVLLRGLTKD